jgi:hypothetical protein
MTETILTALEVSLAGWVVAGFVAWAAYATNRKDPE